MHTLWHILTKKVLENSGKKAWLIIDSTIKGKRGKKLCNLQKFKTAHGYTVGHCFVFALLVCEDGSEHIVAVKPYVTKKFSRRTKREFKTQNQLAVEILQEIQTPLTTHLIVVADSAFLADFVVDEIRRHSHREICYAYLLRWRIEVLFKELKQYLHFGSYQFRELEAYMNHILLVVLAYAMLKHLYPDHTVAEAKKLAYESSQKEFLYELRHDLTKFHGNKIVKNKILQAIPAIPSSLPLRVAG